MRRSTRLAHSLFLALVALATTLSPAAESPKKTIGVLIFDGVLTSDVTAPLEVFGKAVRERKFAHYEVVTIAPERRPITTEEGVVLVPRYSLDDAPRLDVLIVGSALDMKPLLSNRSGRAERPRGLPAIAPEPRSWAKPNCSRVAARRPIQVAS